MTTIDDCKQLVWLEPWAAATTKLERELAKEVGPQHALYGRAAIAVGRRYDNDDVLFFLPGYTSPLAVVHLTWTSGREEHPNWPHTVFYSSLANWIEHGMKPDHLSYKGTTGQTA